MKPNEGPAPIGPAGAPESVSLWRRLARLLPGGTPPAADPAASPAPAAPQGQGEPASAQTSKFRHFKRDDCGRPLSAAKEKELGELGKAILGDNFHPDTLGDLAGAPEDEHTEIIYGPSKFKNTPGIDVRVNHPNFDIPMERFIGMDEEGAKFVKNRQFFLKEGMQGGGAGLGIFSKQVKTARALGFRKIKTHAARDDDPQFRMVGYSVWPKMGYDQAVDRLPEKVRLPLQQKFPAAKTIQDVVSTPEGEAWWREHGDDLVHAEFDLGDESRSMAVLRKYREKKGLPAHFADGGQVGAKPSRITKGARNKHYSRRYLERIDEIGRRILGEHYAPETIAQLVGAPEGSQVSYFPYKAAGLHVHVKHPDIEEMKRTITQEPDYAPGNIQAAELPGGTHDWNSLPKVPAIWNEVLRVKEGAQGKGIGSAILGRQVQAAAGLGVKKIKTFAARTGSYIGYKTWPKMGYDAPIASLPYEEMRAAIGEKFPAAKTIQDVVSTPEGEAWWGEHGHGFEAEFDVAEGSRSRQKLASYLAQKESGAPSKFHKAAGGQADQTTIAATAGETIVPPTSGPAHEVQSRLAPAGSDDEPINVPVDSFVVKRSEAQKPENKTAIQKIARQGGAQDPANRQALEEINAGRAHFDKGGSVWAGSKDQDAMRFVATDDSYVGAVNAFMDAPDAQKDGLRANVKKAYEAALRKHGADKMPADKPSIFGKPKAPSQGPLPSGIFGRSSVDAPAVLSAPTPAPPTTAPSAGAPASPAGPAAAQPDSPSRFERPATGHDAAAAKNRARFERLRDGAMRNAAEHRAAKENPANDPEQRRFHQQQIDRAEQLVAQWNDGLNRWNGGEPKLPAAGRAETSGPAHASESPLTQQSHSTIKPSAAHAGSPIAAGAGDTASAPSPQQSHSTIRPEATAAAGGAGGQPPGKPPGAQAVASAEPSYLSRAERLREAAGRNQDRQMRHLPFLQRKLAEGLKMMAPSIYDRRHDSLDDYEPFSQGGGKHDDKSVVGDDLAAAIDELVDEIRGLREDMKKARQEEPGPKKDGSFVPGGPTGHGTPRRRGVGGFGETPVTPGMLAAQKMKG